MQRFQAWIALDFLLCVCTLRCRRDVEMRGPLGACKIRLPRGGIAQGGLKLAGCKYSTRGRMSVCLNKKKGEWRFPMRIWRRVSDETDDRSRNAVPFGYGKRDLHEAMRLCCYFTREALSPRCPVSPLIDHSRQGQASSVSATTMCA